MFSRSPASFRAQHRRSIHHWAVCDTSRLEHHQVHTIFASWLISVWRTENISYFRVLVWSVRIYSISHEKSFYVHANTLDKEDREKKTKEEKTDHITTKAGYIPCKRKGKKKAFMVQAPSIIRPTLLIPHFGATLLVFQVFSETLPHGWPVHSVARLTFLASYL